MGGFVFQVFTQPQSILSFFKFCFPTQDRIKITNNSTRSDRFHLLNQVII